MRNKYLSAVVGLIGILGLAGCDNSGEKNKEQVEDKSATEAQKASFSGTEQGANEENVPTQVATEIQQTAEQPKEKEIIENSESEHTEEMEKVKTKEQISKVEKDPNNEIVREDSKPRTKDDNRIEIASTNMEDTAEIDDANQDNSNMNNEEHASETSEKSINLDDD